jgi:hypothetical protein
MPCNATVADRPAMKAEFAGAMRRHGLMPAVV